MTARSLVYQLFQRLGWEVHRIAYPSSEEILLKRFLAGVRPSVILDVGANIGQYGLSLRKCGFAGRIVSFEAIPAVHARLAAAASGDRYREWLVAPCCAMGRASGTSKINLARNSVSSSLLPMNEAHLKSAPDSKYVASEFIRVERLDEIAPPLLGANSRIFLKVDTQGYEEEVLAGSSELMKNIYAMQLEISLAPLYQGAPDLRRILELCEGLGFHLHGLIPGFYDEITGRLLQIDGLFLRNDSP